MIQKSLQLVQTLKALLYFKPEARFPLGVSIRLKKAILPVPNFSLWQKATSARCAFYNLPRPTVFFLSHVSWFQRCFLRS